MSERELKEAFEFIRKTIFPKWDRKSAWIVKEEHWPKLFSDGLCELEEKIIYINESLKGNRVFVVLIHEICHAVASPYHGKKFLNRLIKAAEILKKGRYDELSRMVFEEVRIYEESREKLTVAVLYQQVYDWVLDKPTVTYNEMLNAICLNYGYPPKDFLNKHKTFKRRFEEIHKEITHDKLLEERLQERLAKERQHSHAKGL